MSRIPRHLFTCPSCRSHRAEVEREFIVETEVEETIPCSCDQNEAFASWRVYIRWEQRTQTGDLDDEGRVEWSAVDSFEFDVADTDHDIDCPACVDAASPNDVEVEQRDPEEDADSVKWTLRCGRCHVEVPFEWSRPDGTGLIIPGSPP